MSTQQPLPQYSQPQYTNPQQPQAYARQAGTNTLAIVSLICGIIGFNVIAVICGHIAIRQIRRSGEGGLPMAIIGTILGYLALLALVFLVLLALAGGTAGIIYGQS